MLISNSIGKNKIENFSNPSSTSNLFMRSDGFRKVIKGFSSTKLKQGEQLTHSKLHTSSGFRRITKQYKLQADIDKNDTQQNRIMSGTNFNRTTTANKDFSKRNTMFLGQGVSNTNVDIKTVEFLKSQQEEEQCFRNICKVLNIN